MDRQTLRQAVCYRIDDNENATVGILSMPVARTGPAPGRLADLKTQVVPVGWWPRSACGRRERPRRSLLLCMSDQPLPSELSPSDGRPSRAKPAGAVPELSIVDRNGTGFLFYEVDEVVFRQPGSDPFGFRIGVQWRDEYHWWEWVRIEQLWTGPVCTAWRIGGYIDVEPETEEYYANRSAREVMQSERLHYQHWLLGEAYVLCFANGVIRMTCRHVNNHRFDEGREQRDILPVLAFRVEDAGDVNETLDASRKRFSLGNLKLNLADAAQLVSPEHPGRLACHDNLIIYQPYEGIEIEGDKHGRARQDGFIVKAEERRMPKGLARTVRFDLSMTEAEPEIARYAAPSWYYALCGDYWPDEALPVRGEYDERIEAVADSSCSDKTGRFDEGVLGWAWEGESPYAELLHFYQYGKKNYYDYGIRDAYHVADIAFDHSTETVRMHDYPMDGSTAPPLFRMVGPLFGYLETGDPYLLEVAESGANHYYWMDRHNWPRRSYGRDGASLRSLIFLWDYTGKEDYLSMAREAVGRLIQCQLPDGSYHDQGGGTGLHAAGQLIIKVWMACLATDPILDYLQRRPDDPVLLEALRKTGEFVLDAQIEEDGETYWAYEYKHGDMDHNPRAALRKGLAPAKLPAGRIAHGHKARLLCHLTRLTQEPRFFAAWQKFYDSQWRNAERTSGGYHLVNKTLQHLPYAQAHQWNAAWEEGRLRLRPMLTPYAPELRGTVLTPVGKVAARLVRAEDGTWEVAVDGPAELQTVVELPGGAGTCTLAGTECKHVEQVAGQGT